MASLAEIVTKAGELKKGGDAAAAVEAYRSCVFGEAPNDGESLKLKEQALTELCGLYVDAVNADALAGLLTELRPLFGVMPKAKTAKLVRGIIDQLARIPGSTALQLEVCAAQVEWARSEKRTFLRQRLESRLATLHMAQGDYQKSLSLISTLLSEVKRLDDKLLLVDIFLLESRVHQKLRNLPKAKASLTAARTASQKIYIPPSLQAEIDTQSGVLNSEEKDYTTAYSYFYEAFEAFSALDDPAAINSLKYMLLCKIMTGDAEDVPTIVQTKAGLKYTGVEVEALTAVAKAHKERSLKDLQAALETYKDQLAGDPVVHLHLNALYDTLLESNLCRLIEPYSRVEIAHIAKLIELPADLVEQKLSQMILDKKFAGTLDQGNSCLEVFETPPDDKLYPAALEVFTTMGSVVDTLFVRSQRIVA